MFVELSSQHLKNVLLYYLLLKWLKGRCRMIPYDFFIFQLRYLRTKTKMSRVKSRRTLKCLSSDNVPWGSIFFKCCGESSSPFSLSFLWDSLPHDETGCILLIGWEAAACRPAIWIGGWQRPIQPTRQSRSFCNCCTIKQIGGNRCVHTFLRQVVLPFSYRGLPYYGVQE